ncbi:MAG: FKBP-type peptidyl-prolyl cis-trans isomerase [Opitutaceae bacterium]|jgi:FKBP-type peptidyl-prolyl cis-trans isomerase|nr:FKBP-type peptidyl-prolyl cis-trans isomerase [Cephaloticoccus sp.]MCP5529493.1 FKBP-type peptidyl-prolyl cis-trans isomerase [Opitutaceae bacterium]
MRNFLIIALVGLGLLTLALVVRSGIFARKDPGRPINSTMRLAMENSGRAELSTEDAWLVEKQFTSKHRQPSGLMYVPRRAGEGPTPKIGQEIVVDYQGRLLDGTVFDSSYDKGVPLTFRVGLGQVIQGWDESFLNMRKGEKRTLIIPYWLAYGVNGRPPTIPPRATLVFEVELLDIR